MCRNAVKSRMAAWTVKSLIGIRHEQCHRTKERETRRRREFDAHRFETFQMAARIRGAGAFLLIKRMQKPALHNPDSASQICEFRLRGINGESINYRIKTIVLIQETILMNSFSSSVSQRHHSTEKLVRLTSEQVSQTVGTRTWKTESKAHDIE